MGILAEDTSPQAEAVLVELLRRQSPARRLESLRQAVLTGRFLVLSGLRERHPEWDEQRLLEELGGRDGMQPDPIALLVQVGSLLDRLGAPYFATGSVGSSRYGEPRFTQDVDVVAELGPEHAVPLFEAVKEEFNADLTAIQEAIRRRGSFNLIHLASGFKVDVHVSRGRDFERSRFERRRQAEGFTVATPEDVLLGKLEWYRLGGEVSDRQWRDILGVLLVQGEALDCDYLSEWAARLGVGDLWERARDAALGRP